MRTGIHHTTGLKTLKGRPLVRAAAWFLAAVLGLLVACGTPAQQSSGGADAANPVEDAQNEDAPEDAQEPDAVTEPLVVRVATYNVSFHRAAQGQLATDLADPEHAQAKAVAEVIQRVRPDVLLLCEFDYDAQGQGLSRFADNFLAVAQAQDVESIDYPHQMVFASNTGQPSGVDLDNNGQVVTEPGSGAYGGDSLGFGVFPGQYAFAVLSKYPLDRDAVRTFQNLKWSAMPDNMFPGDFYSAEAAEVMVLSSKNHVDLPVQIDDQTLHFLLSHPTPPVFDGPEDRNGRRNFDELRLWADYLTGDQAATYIQDDAGRAGGLDAGAHFVIAGDLNADPNDGDSAAGAIAQLLEHPAVNPQPIPAGDGGLAQADQGINANHKGQPQHDTTDFEDARVGNLRLDYVLPSKTLGVTDSGVFWPAPESAQSSLVEASDHRLVWIDVNLRP